MKENARTALLREAESLVNGPRNDTYGPPKDDFARTAKLWAGYLGVDIEAHDVAALMILLKISRLRISPDHRDSWTDAAGYAACGWDCVA
jgi:hypothetical protein